MQEGKNIWSLILAAIRKELSEEEFYIWFENLYFIDATDNSIKISAPNSFHKNQVEKRFAKRIKEILIEKNHNTINVEFINPENELKIHDITSKNNALKNVSIQQDSTKKRLVFKTHTKNVEENTKKYTIKEEIHTKYRNPFLKKKYTFENFITGPNNKLAYNASLSIAKNPGKKYNPCLIYGGVGLGKTHLLQSIGNKTEELHKEFKILYVTAENFLNEFVESIKTNETKRFKKKYRYLDMLLLDDIHDLQKKEGIQEELFHTFNALYEDNKQMVFTCDRQPSELTNFTDRLKSRFTRGLNVDISKPNFELRIAIIEKKVEEDGIKVPKNILNLVAKKVTTNIRDLEAAVTKLKAYIDLEDIEIDTNIVEKIIKEIIAYEQENTNTHNKINIENIKKVILRELKLTNKDIEGNSKKPEITKARHIYAYLLRNFTELSTIEIGKIIGGKTHSTVIYSINKIDRERNNDLEINNLIIELMNKINKN
ncbi:Chromosomal replication initiator protein DnaA [Borrelia miyamotoi]|uniref:Chromosomal replication initiator protein DnaA n=1 Tax=Borrelia miyamotoi TaxID=47466 RepID=A0AAP8YWF4_9SPIR|nr:chromosomal replication initiator protein DnaA [Borrelia miyamotoi]AHH04973.1 Chromosomal replication initiator protein dnaA [Borrelia miyamotoi FR64b]ATQ14787.1 chromosomal replication initiator protein DnaA [Borrelia miyamotoi]ATQ15972.1 chromosomal replication initiator protein DnaA [Borrelia miyamotoi]ATQ17115.1 chromosomal replication initiator protein DnaA [Borrelia miyamotoi]ATQ18378.1 chromosomal replication initiator protein DnaA [Borrelia miyamotoi]